MQNKRVSLKGFKGVPNQRHGTQLLLLTQYIFIQTSIQSYLYSKA